MTNPQSELEDAAPLPRGRHGLAPEEVAAHQRERIVAAIGHVVAEQGYGALTVERVLAVAGVSRSTFYVHFANKQEAVLAAHEVVFGRFLASLEGACAAQTEWPLKISNGIAATVDFATSRPEQIHLLSTGSLSADDALAERIVASHERLADLLEGARADSPFGDRLPVCTEQFLVAGIASFVASCLVNEETDRLRGVQAELIELTLIPYYGNNEAARLARQPG
jgi:AcrR family transcriptional regulator